MINEFKTMLTAHQLNLSDKQTEDLLAYMQEVLIINDQINLTAITKETAFMEKHLLDSLLCDLDHLEKGSTVIDIGTGGGFPGVPLAIKYPDLHFMLMDSTAKKLAVVESITREIGIDNVSFLTGRAEESAKDKQYREKFDAAVSRGVANLSILCELCLPFVKNNGNFYAWKGMKFQEEIDDAENALKTLNSKILKINRHHLMKTKENHVIISILKKKSIDTKYPRNFGTMKKKPL